MTTMRRMHSLRSGFSRLVLVALVAVTVLGGTLAIGANTASARASAEWCAAQSAGASRHLALSRQALVAGNLRSSMAFLATVDGILQASADAGGESTTAV